MNNKKTRKVWDINELKIGDRVIPISNKNGHTYQLGKEYEIIRFTYLTPSSSPGPCPEKHNPTGFVAKDPETGYQGNKLIFSEVELVIGPETKEDFEEEKERLECELEDINTKIQFMEENNLDEFDEDEYRIFKSLDVLDDKEKSRKDKAKELKRLLKNDSC